MPENAGQSGRASRRILRGLRAQLLLWTIAPLALVLILLSLAGVTRHRQAMTQLVEDRDRALITAEANRLGRDIAQRTADVSRIGATLPADSPPLALVAFLERADTGRMGLALLDRQGALKAASPAAAAWADGPSAHILAARTSAVGQPQYETDAPGSDAARLLVGVPVADGETLVGALPLEALRLNDTSLLVEGEAQDRFGCWIRRDAASITTGRSVPHQTKACWPASLVRVPAPNRFAIRMDKISWCPTPMSNPSAGCS